MDPVDAGGNIPSRDPGELPQRLAGDSRLMAVSARH